MKTRAILRLVALASILLPPLCAFTGDITREEPIRRDFEIENARLREVGQKLIDSYRASVCLEEARMFAVDGDTEEKVRELEERRKRGITLKLKNATLRQALDKLIEVEPVYIWEFDEKTRHFNVFPKEEAPLGWKIGNVDFKDKTLNEALLHEDLLGLEKHGVEYLPPFSSNGRWDRAKMSFKAADITARDALNRICVEYARDFDREIRWTLYETGRDGLLRRRLVTISPSWYQDKTKNRLGPIVTDFKIENERLPKVTGQLTHAFRAIVCAELRPLFLGDDVPQEKITKWDKTSMRISFEVKQATLAEALDKLIEVAPHYTWKLDKETGIFNVYPKEDAPLGWTIEEIDFKDKTLYEVLKGEDLLDLKKHSIDCVELRATGPPWAIRKVSLKAEDITAREALNRLCLLYADDSGAPGRRRRARWVVTAVTTHGVWTGPLRFYGVLFLPE